MIRRSTHTDLMADDIRALLDHLGLARADVMGYSMGARNTAFLARAPRRAGTLGDSRRPRHSSRRRWRVAGIDRRCARAPSVEDVTDPQDGCSVCLRIRPSPTAWRSPPVSAVRGSRCRRRKWRGSRCDVDRGRRQGQHRGSPHELAALVPGARALDIPGRDHMLSVGDRVFKEAVLRFLEERP